MIEDPFKTPTPEQYVRLAGFVSVFGFVSSYNPVVFGKIFEVIAQKLQTGPPETGTTDPKK